MPKLQANQRGPLPNNVRCLQCAWHTILHMMYDLTRAHDKIYITQCVIESVCMAQYITYNV